MEDQNNKELITQLKKVIKYELKKNKSSATGLSDKLFTLIPNLLWLSFALLIFCLFFKQIKYDIIPNITSFKIAGFEATLKKSISELSNTPHPKEIVAYISPVQRDLIIERSSNLYKKLNRAKILWVDSNIRGNEDLRKTLKKWDVKIDCATTDTEAFAFLRNSKIDSAYYDLIITNNTHYAEKIDNHYTGSGDAKKFASKVRSDFPQFDVPIILFSASYGYKDNIKLVGVPEDIFAATNRYDYLFHFILDALERGNTPYPASIQRYVN